MRDTEKETLEELKVFCTSDIAIAAFLITKGFSVTSVSKDQKGQFFFEFKNEEEIQKVALDFLSSECFSFDSNMRMLRSLLKSKRS